MPGTHAIPADRRVHQAPLVGAVQRLAGDLLGREDREVRDLLADLADRTLRFGLDVSLGLLEQVLVPLVRGCGRLVLVFLCRTTCPGHDLLGLSARLLPADRK